MNIQFPIFILAKDDLSINMISDSRQLSRWYEEIDVKNNEYSGWDSNGYSLTVLWNSNIGTTVEIADETSQMDKLREAIFNYAKLRRPKIPFAYPDPKNIVELFKAAQIHIKKGNFIQKIKRLFTV